MSRRGIRRGSVRLVSRRVFLNLRRACGGDDDVGDDQRYHAERLLHRERGRSVYVAVAVQAEVTPFRFFSPRNAVE